MQQSEVVEDYEAALAAMAARTLVEARKAGPIACLVVAVGAATGGVTTHWRVEVSVPLQFAEDAKGAGGASLDVRRVAGLLAEAAAEAVRRKGVELRGD